MALALALPVPELNVVELGDATWQDLQQKTMQRLLLLEALLRPQMGFLGDQARRRKSSNRICEARRDFLDGFSYLCDIERGGSTVTSAILQRRGSRNALWLAANEGIRPEVKQYARRILVLLNNLRHGGEWVWEEIYRLALTQCSPRLQSYMDGLLRPAIACVNKLEQGSCACSKGLRPELMRLVHLLQASRTPRLRDIVDICHQMRTGALNRLRRCRTTAIDEFDTVAHLIYRLGATRQAVEDVVAGVKQVSSLRTIHFINTLPAPEVLTLRQPAAITDARQIFLDITRESTYSNPRDTSVALQALIALDCKPAKDLSRRIAKHANLPVRVHAEVQLADYASRKTMAFVDRDMYVGCTKPACYFCFNWITNHQKGFESPATHHKVILGCRGPDDNLTVTGENHLRLMYAKMCSRVEQDIFQFLLDHEGRDRRPRRCQYMSTNGTTIPPSLPASLSAFASLAI